MVRFTAQTVNPPLAGDEKDNEIIAQAHTPIYQIYLALGSRRLGQIRM